MHTSCLGCINSGASEHRQPLSLQSSEQCSVSCGVILRQFAFEVLGSPLPLKDPECELPTDPCPMNHMSPTTPTFQLPPPDNHSNILLENLNENKSLQVTMLKEKQFFFFLVFFRAASVAYGSSQARDQIGPTAASLHHSRSNARSEPYLQPTPQLTTTLDP